MDRQGLLWVIVADLALVAAGALAYVTTWRLLLAAFVAGVVALPGVLDLRKAAREAHGTDAEAAALWLDKALSYLIGLLTTAVVLIVLPYLTTGEDGSLWQYRSYAGLGLAVVGGGWLLWHAALLQALRPTERPFATPPALLTLVLTGVALVLLVQGYDDVVLMDRVDGVDVPTVDLTLTALVVGAAGLPWALAALRERAPAGGAPT
ncbi:MAG: hypothetical protein ACPGQL_03210 [Thermoplasmatota archaeon]